MWAFKPTILDFKSSSKPFMTGKNNVQGHDTNGYTAHWSQPGQDGNSGPLGVSNANNGDLEKFQMGIFNEFHSKRRDCYSKTIFFLRYLFGEAGGKRMTSRIEGLLEVKSMRSRSIPMPTPPAGGIPLGKGHGDVILVQVHPLFISRFTQFHLLLKSAPLVNRIV